MTNLEREPIGISRRKFLIGGASTGASFLASKWGVERIINNFSSPLDLEKLKDYTVLPPEFPIPSELVGINLNAPFLWREVDSPEKIERAIKNAYQFEARTIRVFINDEFEPELGNYRFEVLEKIEKLAQKFPLQVDLFDGYPLLFANKFNPVYGSSSLSSPYLRTRIEKPLIQRQLDFFTDKTTQEIFLRRIKKIVGCLNQVPQIVAWSVANELKPPMRDKKEATEILTNWYVEVVTEIRKIDPKRPILSGVTNPALLDEERLKQCSLTANTFHLYPFSDGYENTPHTQHQKSLPLVCQEIGFPSRIFRFSFSPVFDKLFTLFLSNNLSQFIEVNEREKWLKPKVTSIGLWRLTFEGDPHQDGFEIAPKDLPKTLKLLQDWEKILTKI